MKAKSLLAILLLAVVAGAIALPLIIGRIVRPSSGSAVSKPVTVSVRRGKLKASFVESGLVQAKRSVLYYPEFARNLWGNTPKITWLIDEGKMVRKGQEIAKFDRADVQKQIDDLQKELDKRTEALDQQKTEKKLWEIKIEKQNTELINQQIFAQMALNNLIQGEGRLRMEQNESSVRKATAAHERESSRFKDLQALNEEGFVTDEEIEQQEFKVTEALETLNKMKSEWEVYEKYTYPLEEAKAKAELSTRNEGIQRFKLTVAEETAQWDRKKDNVDKEAEALEERIGKVQEALLECTVLAKVDGFIIRSEGWFGGKERKVQIGDQPWSQQAFLEQPDLSRWIVHTQIREVDLPRIRNRNPKVALRVDAFKDVQFVGRIVTIGVLSNLGKQTEKSGRKISNSFPLTVDLFAPGTDLKTILAEPDMSPTAELPDLASSPDVTADLPADPNDPMQLLRPGMTARVEIITDNLDDVLLIPEDAVHEDDEGAYVLIPAQNDAGHERRSIVRGISDGDFVEIKEGLKESDRVILRSSAGSQ